MSLRDNFMQLNLTPKVTADDPQVAKVDREKIRTQIPSDSLRLDGRTIGQAMKISIGYKSSDYSLNSSSPISSQDKSLFQNKNADLLYVIGKSDEAQTLLSKTQVRSRDDLSRVISQTASSLLNKTAKDNLDEKTLEKNVALSSMIVLNTGKIRDLINKDPSVSKLLSDKADDPQSDVYRVQAEKAASLFDKKSTLNDAKFFEAHPKVASFFLEHPDVVAHLKSINNTEDEAGKYKSRVDDPSYVQMLDSFISENASAKTQLGSFNETFYAANIDTAEFVSAGENNSKIPTPSEFLRKNPQYGLNNISAKDGFDIRQFVKDVTGFEAKNALSTNSNFDSDFLRENTSIARLILKNKAFRTEIAKEDANHDIGIIVAGDKSHSKLSKEVTQKLNGAYESQYKDPKKVSVIA